MINPGMISEYYDTVYAALSHELRREPSHTEVMEIVLRIIEHHLSLDKSN
jgi:hypothetical protein